MVHQEFMLIPGYTITENIKINHELTNPNPISRIFGKQLETLDMKRMNADARKALDIMGMDIEEYTMVEGLPVGHMQFIEIAREADRVGSNSSSLMNPPLSSPSPRRKTSCPSSKSWRRRELASYLFSHRLTRSCRFPTGLPFCRTASLW